MEGMLKRDNLVQVVVHLSRSLIEQLDDHAKTHGPISRSAAIRQICQQHLRDQQAHNSAPTSSAPHSAGA
jgi:metal-responsive CopG/Arc/MetJ family transcriptional regulator